MKFTNYFEAIALSLCSSKFYQEVGQYWRGRSLVYLLILLAILKLTTAFVDTNALWAGSNKLTNAAMQQMPIITFKHGVASTQKAGPFYINVTKHDFFVVDTQNKLQNLSEIKAIFFVRNKAIVFRKSAHEIQTISYSEKIYGNLEPKQIKHFFNAYKKRIISIAYSGIYLFSLFFYYIYYFIGAALLSLITLFITAITGHRFHYGALFNLTIQALTPAILINTFFSLTNTRFPGSFYLCFGITIIYLIFAMRVNTQK